MPIRVNFLMSFGRKAWSETHYDMLANDIPGAEARARTTAALRAAMLGFDAFVFAARLSDPTRPGSSDLVRFAPPIQGSKFNINIGLITSFTSDSVGDANDAVMVDAGVFINNKFYKSRPMLGGIPFGLVQSIAGTTVVMTSECPDWLKAFNNFQNQMIGGGYGFRTTVEGASFAVQAVQGGAGLAPIGLLVDNGFNPAPQTIVHVRGFRVHPSTRARLAGMWRVQSVAPGIPPNTNVINLANSQTMPAGASFQLPGSIQTAAGFLASYSQFDIATGVTRKRGGNLDLPRGRSPIRVFRG